MSKESISHTQQGQHQSGTYTVTRVNLLPAYNAAKTFANRVHQMSSQTFMRIMTNQMRRCTTNKKKQKTVWRNQQLDAPVPGFWAMNHLKNKNVVTDIVNFLERKLVKCGVVVRTIPKCLKSVLNTVRSRQDWKQQIVNTKNWSSTRRCDVVKPLYCVLISSHLG